MIEEHGGRIALESAPGPGARFTIVLPVAALPGESAVVAPAGTAVSAPVRGAILVVDDEPDIAAILVEAFGRDGHEVDVVHDGASALDRLGRRAYALVVTDSRMPGMDGADFYREMIRRHPAIHGRVMFVTGDVLDRDRLAFLESTGAPFLSKPFEIAEVRHLASRLLAGEGVQ